MKGLIVLPVVVLALTTDMPGIGKGSIAAVGMVPFAVTAVLARVECVVDYASREFRCGIGRFQKRSLIFPATTFFPYQGVRAKGEVWNGIALRYPPNPAGEHKTRGPMEYVADVRPGLPGSGFLSPANQEIWLRVLNGFDDRYRELAAVGVIEGMSDDEFRRSSWKGPGRMILADGTVLRADGTVDPDCRPVGSAPRAIPQCDDRADSDGSRC